MTFWIFTVFVLLCLAALGYRQGAIRVAMSFLGILVGYWLAVPLSGLILPILKPLGIKNPIALWLIPPFVAFCIVSALFKIGAAFLHRKVEVYFKYRAGDLRLALYDRLMKRLGMCLGVLNGSAYLILISFILYSLGYWTVQVGAPQEAKWPVRVLNRLAWDMDATGFSKTARAMDPFEETFYKTADVAGLVYQNSLLEARLSRYPAFLILGETPALQALGDDNAFADLRLRQAPLKELMANQNVDNILKDPAGINEIWATVEPNLDDLNEYLHTGISPQFSDERIYGRWIFNPSASAASMRRSKPNISSREMKRTRQVLQASYGNSSLIIGTDRRMIVKNFAVQAEPGQPASGQSTTGEWRPSGDIYLLTIESPGEPLRLDGVVQGERLTINGLAMPLVFDREV